MTEQAWWAVGIALAIFAVIAVWPRKEHEDNDEWYTLGFDEKKKEWTFSTGAEEAARDVTPSKFNPSKERLDEICEKCGQALAESDPEKITWSEHE